MKATGTVRPGPAEEEARICTAFIELDKLIKRENLAASGGEARHLIAAGLARVNGEVETRKRRKLHPGDTVELEGRRIRIVGERSGLPLE